MTGRCARCGEEVTLRPTGWWLTAQNGLWCGWSKCHAPSGWGDLTPDERLAATSAAAGAPSLSFEERQIVRRFDEAPNPWCTSPTPSQRGQARLPHVQTWDRISCPECCAAVER